MFKILVVVVLLILAVYVKVYHQTVRRYFREHKLGLYATWGFTRRWPVLPRALRILIFIGCFLIAPYLFRKLCDDDYRRERQKRRDEEVKQMREVQEREQRRDEWLKNDPVTLYSHTVDGITVLMTPRMYELNSDRTTRHRRNLLWHKDNVLMPDNSAFIFVDENGRRLIQQNAGLGNSHPVTRRVVSGWVSEMDDFLTKFGIKPEPKRDIFIPFVNETVIPFTDHDYRQHNVFRYVEELVYSQAPSDKELAQKVS